MSLLEVRSLTAGYHDVAAVQGIDLDVNAGEVVALLGANGAGKTTTLLSIAGDIPLISGEVFFDGEPFDGPLHLRARRGMAFVTEERSIFRQLTVDENIALGRGEIRDVFELAPELTRMRSRKAGLLSGGEQQILTLARALAARPRLLLADELSLGLAPLVADRMLQVARQAANEGIAVLLVEQNATRALGVADRAYVLQRGQIVISGDAAHLGDQLELVTEAYNLSP